MHDFIWEGEIDLQICDDIYNFYDNCTYLHKKVYQDGSYGKDSTELNCHMMLAKNEPVLENYLRALMECIDQYIRVYPQVGHIDCQVAPLFNIQKYKPKEGYHVWHFERGVQRENRERFLVWMTYLSDNPDGGTEWLYQDKYVAAKKGKTVIWPAEWTHTHRGVVDENLEKTIITGWVDIT